MREMKFRKFRAGILIVIAMMLSTGRSFSQEQETPTVRVMTYNIWNGFDWGKDSTRKANCINWIKSKQPDVLALQELCGYDEEQLKIDALSWGHSYVQILKTKGYPTALTSNKPIKVKEREIESFWHGLLHCETYGIDFFIVHLSPADAEIRLEEAKQITEKINALNNERYIILGDFNAQSPIDASWVENNQDLKTKYMKKKGSNHSNLRLGEFDYAVMSEFLACPAVDLCLGKMELQDGYTFPTPVLAGLFNNTSENIPKNRVRIDYILASPAFAKYCSAAKVFNQQETALLSDHYPVMVDFNFNKE